MTILHIDFETRSACDIRKAGAEVYARHPSTDVWCMAWAFGDDEPQVVVGYKRGDGFLDPGRDDSQDAIFQHLASGGLVYAHNAAFELAIWNNVMVPRYGWPPLRPEQTRCTMAMAYAMALPDSLDDCAKALGIQESKDAKGYRLMLQMSKPRSINADGSIVWWDDAERLERLYAYCKQDVVVERAIHKKLRELSDEEQALWVLDRKINERGIQIDTRGCEAAIRIVEKEKKRLDAEMHRVTNGAVGACSEVKKLTEWVVGHGVEVAGLAKADVTELLNVGAVQGQVRAALRLRQEAGKSSTAKLAKMLACACPDGRVRGAMQYHGAATGRWAGRLIQIQNYPRPPKYLEDPALQASIIESLETIADPGLIDLLYGAPTDVMSGILRGFLIAAPGHDLISVDYANIEGRVLAWLAGEEWKLQAFRDYDAGTGPDLYLVAAGRIYECSPAEAKPHRQIGKVSELALGYQGGVGAFQTMAKTYGVKVPDEQADSIKVKWRKAHPRIQQFWYDLEAAATKALLNPGSAFSVGGKIKYKMAGDFLWCQLPSKRVLCYPFPELRRVETPWGEKDQLTYMYVPHEADKKKGKILPDPRSFGKWVRGATYGGSLAENVTQAVARCLLSDALPKLEARSYNTVFHVHDEAVVEVPTGFGSVKEMAAIMTELPEWAEGLPVAAEGWRGTRYRKD